MEEDPNMLDFVKALAHADRLKIVGMLVQKPAGLAELAAALSLPARQAYNHLAFLEFVGVVQKEAELYALKPDAGEALARSQFEGWRLPAPPKSDQLPGRQKVLAAFLNPDGTIRQIPNSRTQADKFRIVLEYVLAAFEPGVVYKEKEVNSLIRRFHEDVAGLRRDLIDAGMLQRERDGSRYWRPSKSGEARPV